MYKIIEIAKKQNIPIHCIKLKYNKNKYTRV